MHFAADLVVPNESKSLQDGAIVPPPWSGSNNQFMLQTLESLGRHYGFTP